jgi:hypothetical protein
MLFGIGVIAVSVIISIKIIIATNNIGKKKYYNDIEKTLEVPTKIIITDAERTEINSHFQNNK